MWKLPSPSRTWISSAASQDSEHTGGSLLCSMHGLQLECLPASGKGVGDSSTPQGWEWDGGCPGDPGYPAGMFPGSSCHGLPAFVQALLTPASSVPTASSARAPQRNEKRRKRCSWDCRERHSSCSAQLPPQFPGNRVAVVSSGLASHLRGPETAWSA